MVFDRDFFQERGALRDIARSIVARVKAPLSPSPARAKAGATGLSAPSGAPTLPANTAHVAIYGLDEYNDENARYGSDK